MFYRYVLVFIVWLFVPLLFPSLEFSSRLYRILFALFATGLFWLMQPKKVRSKS